MVQHIDVATDPIMAKVAALALEADEAGYRPTAMALSLVVQCASLPLPVRQRLINSGVMIVEAVQFAASYVHRQAGC